MDIRIQKSILNSVLPVKSINEIVEGTGPALAECLLPKAINPKIRTILDRVSELSMFKYLKKTPKSRFVGGFAQCGDFQFQQEIQKLIYSNIIRPQTMVIASTGHDVPMLAQLHRNPHLRFNSAFQEKFIENAGSIERVADQTLTWGNEIKQAETNIGNNSNGLFLGLETHREWKVDTSQLPSAQELKDLNITRVVHLDEFPPTVVLSSEKTRELGKYYRNLETEGIEVLYKGVDPRYIQEPNRFISRVSLYDLPSSNIYGPKPIYFKKIFEKDKSIFFKYLTI